MKKLIILMTLLSLVILTSSKKEKPVFNLEELKDSNLLNVMDVRAYPSGVYCIFSKDKLSLVKGIF